MLSRGLFVLVKGCGRTNVVFRSVGGLRGACSSLLSSSSPFVSSRSFVSLVPSSSLIPSSSPLSPPPSLGPVYGGRRMVSGEGKGPMKEYLGLIEKGDIHADDNQKRAATLLQDLFNGIEKYKDEYMSNTAPPPLPPPPPPPAPTKTQTFLQKFELLSRYWEEMQGSSAPTRAPRPREQVSQFYEMPDTAGVPGLGAGESEDEFLETLVGKDGDRPRGLYLHGDVGCGKTFLMDIFYDSAPVLKKKRVHFHSFMIDVQRRIHHWKMTEKNDLNYDPIPPLAHAIASENKLLCFDEFQVTDISDAAILHRLLKYLLLKHNVVFVFTSNRPPSELYKNGINREIFVPCINLIEKSLDIYDMDSKTDYRLLTKMAGSCYLSPPSSDNKQKFEALWDELSKGDGHEDIVEHTGREVMIPQAAHGTARFTFDYLCKKPLGAADFLEIARRYHTVMLSDIPCMTLLEKVEARRFITLVDALYEHHVRLLCTAEATPHNLFSKGEGKGSGGVEDWAINTGGENLAIHTGEEELFMFNRCVSRLIEMQSEEYLAKEHLAEEDYATKYNYVKKK